MSGGTLTIFLSRHDVFGVIVVVICHISFFFSKEVEGRAKGFWQFWNCDLLLCWHNSKWKGKRDNKETKRSVLTFSCNVRRLERNTMCYDMICSQVGRKTRSNCRQPSTLVTHWLILLVPLLPLSVKIGSFYPAAPLCYDIAAG